MSRTTPSTSTNTHNPSHRCCIPAALADYEDAAGRFLKSLANADEQTHHAVYASYLSLDLPDAALLDGISAAAGLHVAEQTVGTVGHDQSVIAA